MAPTIAVAWFTWKNALNSLVVGHQLIVRDYLNIWAGGYLTAHGRIETVFNPIDYSIWLRSIFGDWLDLHTWSYPPHLLLIAVPLAMLGLVPGFLVWVAATSGLLWASLRAGGLSLAATIAVVVSPAAMENIMVGQNGALLAGASLSGGLLLAVRAPLLAGALLGLLTLKPQLGVLVPVCLLARREMRPLMWAAVFGAAYCCIGLVAFGIRPWLDYVSQTAPFMSQYLDAPFGRAGHYLMVPPFTTARALGLGLAEAYAIQTVALIICILLVGWAWALRDGNRRAAVALALCLAPLATPYSHAYDLVCVAVACAILVRLEQEAGAISLAGWLCLAPAWLWPSVALIFGVLLCPGLGAPAVALPVAVALRHLRQRTHAACETSSSSA